MKRWLTVVAAVTALGGIMAWAQWPVASLPPDTRADRVVVVKSARTLEIFRGTELLRSYRVSLGRAPDGPKRQEGDGRTPEGDYTLDYRKSDSTFHRALHISYPSSGDRTVSSAQGVNPGGLIMVHGVRNGLGFVGRLHRLFDWTDGCIAVTNLEIDEIWRVVPDGTPIRIEP